MIVIYNPGNILSCGRKCTFRSPHWLVKAGDASNGDPSDHGGDDDNDDYDDDDYDDDD